MRPAPGLFLSGVLAFGIPVAAQAPSTTSTAIQIAVESVGDTSLRGRLFRFYAGLGWRLVWSGDSTASARAQTLLDILGRAGDDGLRPSDYGVEPGGLIPTAALEDTIRTAQRDVRLSAGFFAYGRDLAGGRVPPQDVDSLWDGRLARRDVSATLVDAVRQDRIAVVLAELRPPQAGYRALQDALARYRVMAQQGGWGALPDGPPLALGDTGAPVVALGQRLSASGDVTGLTSGGSVFDSSLAAGVRHFQDRHGLEADGVVGPATREALNVSVERRIATLALNLERWRWIPRDLGRRYIVVNIPAFALELREAGSTTLTFRAVVGRRDWPTPITNAWLEGVTFHPVWNIPRGIALQEVVPQEAAHPGWLARTHIRVVRLADGREVSPDSVDWRAVSETTFAYRLVQDPGPTNPLGRLRFDVRDPFNVAIHDTPERILFRSPIRVFSHGCVRVEGVRKLAAAVLRGTPGGSLPEIRAALAADSEWTVRLSQPLRVVLMYETAWVGADGVVQFRDDVYGWDDILAAALARSPIWSDP